MPQGTGGENGRLGEKPAGKMVIKQVRDSNVHNQPVARDSGQVSHADGRNPWSHYLLLPKVHNSRKLESEADLTKDPPIGMPVPFLCPEYLPCIHYPPSAVYHDSIQESNSNLTDGLFLEFFH